MEKKEGNNSNDGNRTRKPYFILLGVLAVFVVLGVVLAASGRFNTTIEVLGKRDAKSIMFEALAGKTAKKQVSAFEEIIGVDLFKLTDQKSVDAGFRLTIEGAEDIPQLDALSGNEIYADIAADAATKKTSGTVGIGSGGTNLFNADFITDRTNLNISLPQFTEKLFTVDLTKDLEKQINESYIANKYNIDAASILSMQSLFRSLQDIIQGGIPMLDIVGILNRYENNTAYIQLKKDADVIKIDPKEFEVNGQLIQCEGYELKISKPNIIIFLKALRLELLKDDALKNEVRDFILQLHRISNNKKYTEAEIEQKIQKFWDELDTDFPATIEKLDAHMRCVVMDVYLDPSGNIISLDALSAYLVEEEMTTLTLEMDNKGGYTTNENMEVVFTIGSDENESKYYFATSGNSKANLLDSAVQFSVEEDGSNTFSVNLSGKYDKSKGNYRVSYFCNGQDRQILYFSSNGKINEYTKGTSADIDLDSLIVVSEGKEVIDVSSGSLYFRPLSQPVKELTGDPFDLLGAAEEEWEDLLKEISEKVFPFIYSLQSMIN